MVVALWMSNVEEKVKMAITTTPLSILTITFTLLTLALFATILALLLLLRKSTTPDQHHRHMLMDMDECGWTSTTEADHDHAELAGGSRRWVTIRKVLMSSMRWSEGSRWVAEDEELMMTTGSIVSCTSTNNSCCSLAACSESRAVASVKPKPSEVRAMGPTIVSDKRLGAAAVLLEKVTGQLRPLMARGSAGQVANSSPSLSAVWQRPILMGERCELPNHSGVILYDERGRPLHPHFHRHHHHHHHHSSPASSHYQHHQRRKAEEASGRRTTLKDLM